MKLNTPWHWRYKPPVGTGLAFAPTGPQALLRPYIASLWLCNEGGGTVITDLASEPQVNLSSNFGIIRIHDPLNVGNYWAGGQYGGHSIQLGNGKYLEGGTSGNYDGGAGAVWFRFKVRASDLSTSGSAAHAIHSRADASNSFRGFTIYLDTTTHFIATQVKATGSPGGGVTIKGSTNLADGAWHTVLLNFNQSNATNCQLWVDGELVAQAPTSGSWAFNNQVLRWGLAQDSFWQPFPGQIEPGAWIKRQLYPQEIFDLYLHPFDLMRSPGWVVMYPPGFPPSPVNNLKHKTPKRAPQVPVPQLVW
jgi:hypothetical protein